jgi:uncharacterized protein (UPF0276 family)
VSHALLGLNLLPDRDHLAHMARVLEEEAEFFEVTPETLWDADLEPSARHATLNEIIARSGRPVVGHGVHFSPGAPGPEARVERHLAALRRDHAAFGFRWFSEHLGFARADGLVAELPLPLPFTRDAIGVVAASVARLAATVPSVALENQAALFCFGDPRREPEFLNEVCAQAGCGLLLDLHNAFVQSRNFSLDLGEWLAAVDLDRVTEIHVSGGSDSEPRWLPSRRVFRLDSHDGPVPEEVWRALDRVLPRCPNLRGVVLERNDGTLDDANRGAFEAEVRRLRSILC